MHGSLPLYCETALNTAGHFPAEPINAITSFAPVLFGVMALIYLRRRQQKSLVAFALAILTILTGFGSVAWHALRSETALVFDVLPGLAYFALAVLYWAYHVRGRPLVIALLVAGGLLLAFLPPASRLEGQILTLSVLAVVASGLLAATWLKRRQAFAPALLMVGAAVVAAGFRTLDLSVCHVSPVGTHFFWHIFLGLAAYAGVRLAASLTSAVADRKMPSLGTPASSTT